MVVVVSGCGVAEGAEVLRYGLEGLMKGGREVWVGLLVCEVDLGLLDCKLEIGGVESEISTRAGVSSGNRWSGKSFFSVSELRPEDSEECLEGVLDVGQLVESGWDVVGMMD